MLAGALGQMALRLRPFTPGTEIAGTVRGYYHAAKVLGPAEWGEVDRCDAVILTHGD